MRFDSYSIFHYFASNSEVIERIHSKFITELNRKNLSESEKKLPLQILCPDNQGKSALFHASSTQSPRSFECMVSLISDMPDVIVSKMILKSLPIIISH